MAAFPWGQSPYLFRMQQASITDHMETYYCRCFLKQIHIWGEVKCSHYITSEIMPHLDILYYQVKSPVSGIGYILVCHWTKGFLRQPSPPKKTHRLLQNLLVVLHSMMVRPYCWRHNLLCHQTWRHRAGALLEASPWLTSIMVLEGIPCQRRKWSLILPSYKPFNLQQ